MNKVFSLFMICAMAVSLTAADTLFFNRYQFQPALGSYKTGDAISEVADLAAITVPFVYNGNLKLTGYGAADDDWVNYEYADNDCFVGKNSVNLPIYMTICQPCLDCYPCAVLGQENDLRILDNAHKVGKCEVKTDYDYGWKALIGSVTRWNLYVVENGKWDDGTKFVCIYKVNLMTTQADVDSVFFTGRKGSGNDSYAFAQYMHADDYHNTATQFAMIGKKNDYKFKFNPAKLKVDGTWTAVSNASETAYIKSVTKFDGVFCTAKMYGDFVQSPVIYPQFTNPHSDTDYNQITKATELETLGNYYGFQYCGEIKLTRNASLTNMAVKGTFGVTKPKAVKNWEDCDEDIPATYCEEYFLSGLRSFDKMDAYLAEKVYKSYDQKGELYFSVDFVDEYLADFWEDAI